MARRNKKNFNKSQNGGKQNMQNNTNNAKPPASEASGAADTNKDTSDNSKSGDSKDGKDATKTPSINDPEWYKRFPELAFGAANLPFSERLGSPVNMGNLSLDMITTDNKVVRYQGNKLNDAIPGICSVRTKPSYGFNTDLNSPLNIAASQFYTNVRYVNSGRKNYDPADLMIAEMAIADLYAYINWMQRLYGYAYMYSMRNNYINEALISANNVNVTDICEKLANFRYWINTFISRVSAFAVPSTINIFQRRAFMYAHLYTESTTGNIKDQLYQFVPDGFYMFDLDETGKGCLRYKRMLNYVSAKWTLNNIISFGELLLSKISNDEDFGLISGDIIKAYGSNLIGLSPVPEALIIMPEYEEYTLSQIRNAHIANVLRDDTAHDFKLAGNNDETFKTGDVMQANNGNLVTAEALAKDVPYPMIYAVEPGIITVTNPEPSIDDVLECTRLTTCACPTSQDGVQDTSDVTILTTGSDVVVGWTMSEYYFNSNNIFVLLEEFVDSNVIAQSSISNFLRRLDGVHFHWAPPIILSDVRESTDEGVDYNVTRFDILSNVDNYTSMSWDMVSRLHEVAIISLLSVPGVATLVG